MTEIYRLLNVALPPLTFILISVLPLPYLFFTLLLYVKKLILHTENLSNKVVLITGAASGIGEQLAYEYARRGALLSLIDIKKDNLVSVADKARSLGSPDVTIIGADVSKVEDCKLFVDETVSYFGRLDHLVNNAGIIRAVEVENWRDVSEFTPVMDINFWGAVYGTFYAIPHLKISKGKIVVTASSLGWFPIPTTSVYNASKAAVISFFESLRMELGGSIGITIATPGFIRTDLAIKGIHEEAGLGRIPMGPSSECAKAIVKSACRGDMYVTNPSWVKVLFPLKVLFPQIIDFCNRLFLGLSPNSSKNKGILQYSELKAE